MTIDTPFHALILVDNAKTQKAFEKILLSDLNADHVKKLKLDAITINAATDIEKALDHAHKTLDKKTPYALIFIDIDILKLEHAEKLIQKIQTHNKTTQIIIYISHPDTDWEKVINDTHTTDNVLLLIRPFNPLVLRQLTLTLFQKWQLMQEVARQREPLEKIIEQRTACLKNLLAEVEYRAMHDPLTDLPNRMLLLDRMKQSISQAKRYQTSFYTLFIDLDRFKLINDKLSHEAGDTLLKILAKRLKKVTREADTIARLGGDEFILMVLSEPIQNHQSIVRVASKTLRAINSLVRIKHHRISMTASIGISVYPEDGNNPEELLRNADLTMYHAKSLGGNQFQFYNRSLDEKYLSNFEQEVELRQALIKNEFFLDYQPQYDVKNKQLVAVETLIRWRHPTRGILYPPDFIDIAEQTGLIIPIGEWVIKTVCMQKKIWQDKKFAPFRTSVNLSEKQLMQPQLVKFIETTLQETGLNPACLEIEIAEHTLFTHLHLIDVIKSLKKIGLGISIDKFGTSISDLRYLHSAPIDRLKINQSVVQAMNVGQNTDMIIQAIMAIAKSLQLEVTVEGVENKQQLQALETQHCQTFQGHYFSKPMAYDQLETLLESIAQQRIKSL